MLDWVVNIWKALGGGAPAATLMAAFLSLIAVTFGVVSTYATSRRSVYINSITVERSKWIEKMRQGIANYSAAMGRRIYRVRRFREEHGPHRSLKTSPEANQALEDLNAAVSVIQLQLNPEGLIDRNILALLEGIIVTDRAEFSLLQKADKLLISHAQWLLKSEWQEVKYEAGGFIYRRTRWMGRWRRRRAYRKWLRGDGAVGPLLEKFVALGAKLDATPGVAAAGDAHQRLEGRTLAPWVIAAGAIAGAAIQAFASSGKPTPPHRQRRDEPS